jgi:PAS domain S-box-containing protein
LLQTANLNPSKEVTNIRVLHVDDDISMLEMSKLMLLDLDSGFEIDKACCVDEGFSKLAEGHYDVVISDYDMPQKNGLQFLKELREQKNDTPFILFTGKGREEVAISALNLGADGYYNKQGRPETVYGELVHGIKLSVERKKAKLSILLNEVRLQCILDLNKMLDNSDQELMDYALDAIIKITQSDFAFIDLLDQDEKLMTIYSWSKTAMKECKVQVKPIHCPVSEAGIWAEPIRQRKPVNIDDYSVHLPHKKGCPEGHVKIERFLGVPIFEKEHIVVIAAVANKKECYDETDVGHVTSLVTDMWRLIQRKKAEASLKETKAQLELQIKRMPIACIFWDKDFKAVSWNPAAETIFGYTEKEAIGKHPFGTIVPKEAQTIVEKIWRRLLEGDETAHSINDNFTKAGNKITCSWTNTPIKRENNSVIGVLSMVQDVTELTKNQEAIASSEAKFRGLFESIQDGVVITNTNGLVASVNKAAALMFGYKTPEEMANIPAVNLYVNAHDRQILFDILSKKGYVKDYEVKNKRKDGSTFDSIVTSTLRKDMNGKTLQAETIIKDISERKKAEEALLKAKKQTEFDRKRLESILETTPSAVVIIEAQSGKYSFINKRAMQLYGFDTLGLSLDENVAKVKARRADGTEYPIEETPVSRCLKLGQEVHNQEMIIDRADGQVLPIIANTAPLRDMQGNITAAIIVFEDITERKKSEESLRANQRLLAESNRIGKVGGWQFNIDTLKQTWTDETYSIHEVDFNFNPTVENGVSFYTPESRPIIEQAIQQARAYGKPFDVELQITTAKGNLRDVRAIGEANLSKRIVYGFFQDITERKKTEDALKQSETQFSKAFASNPVALCISRFADGFIIDVNETFLRLFGFGRQEAIGHKTTEMNIFINLKDRENLTKILREKGAIHNFEITLQTKTGKPLHILASIDKMNSNGQELILSTFIDITPRKKAEQALEENHHKMELMNEKLRVVGSLTRHDVGNKLMVAKSNLYLLKKRIGDNPDLAKYLERIESSLASSEDIFEFNRFYEKIGLEKISKENVFESFNQAAALMRNLGNVTIVNECQGLEVFADSLLKQLFYNFIDNSFKHGEIVNRIRLHYKEDVDGVKLFYEDNGVGIPEANKLKLFEVGFTTGNSSGLGLYLVKKMIDVYGWTITEEGEEGKGAKFLMTIPKLSENGKGNYQITP